MKKIKEIYRTVFLLPLVKALIKLNISPNLITLLSLGVALIAFFAYKAGKFCLGGMIILIASLLDTFDGEIARQTNRVTKFGGFLDSTIDRINEFLIFLGIFFFYYHHAPYVLFWIFLALFGSLMVSYTRARGEGVGISPQVGIFERFVRLLFLIIGSFLGPQIMVYLLVVITIGTFITTFQRIFYLLNNSKPVE